MHSQKTLLARTSGQSPKFLLGTLATAMIALGSPAASAVTTLIGHWTFDEGSGTTTADLSPNGNTATVVPATGSWIPGKSGGAYSLQSSHFEIVNSTALQVTGAVTVAAWVNPLAPSSFGVIAGIDQTGGGANDMYTLKTDGSDFPRWEVVGPGPDVSFTGTTTLSALSAGTTDGWVHLVGTYDPAVGTASLYANGSLVGSTTSVPTSIQTRTTDFQMGHNASDNGSNYLRAALDEVQVYSGALTSEEVIDIFNNPGNALPVPEPSRVLFLMVGGIGALLRRRR